MDPRINYYPGAMQDTRLQQLAKTDRNPIEEEEYQRLLKEAQGTQGRQGITGDPATDAIIKAQDEANKKFVSKVKEFDEKNPFVYDKILEDETKKVGLRLDPYYKQTLDDFLRGIKSRTSRSMEDERRTLTEISQDVDSYRKETRQNLEDALSRSREGFADIGQYFSGQQLQTTAKQGLESGEREEDYLRGAERRRESSILTYGRQREDLGETQNLFQRDVGQYTGEGFTRGARSEAEVRLQALGEIPRRQAQRDFEMRQWVGSPPGVDPAQYALQSYSLLR